MYTFTLYSLCFGNLSSVAITTTLDLWIMLIPSLNILQQYQVYGGIGMHRRVTFLNLHF